MMGMGEVQAPQSFSGKAGIARRDITPPVGIRARNWGPAEWDRSVGVHRRLSLTALAIVPRAGAPAHVIFAVDGTWWRRIEDEQRVRQAILQRLDLPADRVMFNLSHTHAGPVLNQAEEDAPGGEFISGYLDLLTEAAVSAGEEALGSLFEMRLECAQGTSRVASNRELDLQGSAFVGFNPDREADDTIVIGRLSDASGRVRATLVNYACHPTTLAWQNMLISPDYVGAMREVVESETGGLCLFLQGASGELAPRHQYTGDVTVADAHGAALGHAVLAALAEMSAPATAMTLIEAVESSAPLVRWEPRPCDSPTQFSHTFGEVELEVRALPSLAELEEQWSGIDPRSREERLRRAQSLRQGYATGETVQYPVWAWRWGGIVLVAHPGEAYSQLQLTLRKAFPHLSVVVMNLTNGPGFVYLPTAEAYRADAYQAWQTPLASGSLERLEQYAIDLVSNLGGNDVEE